MYKIIFETDPVEDIPIDPWCAEAIASSDLFTSVDNFIKAKSNIVVESKTNYKLHDKSCRLSGKALAYFEKHTSPDWRLGNIEIIPIDMRPRAQSRSVPLKGKFMGRGVVRLYATNEPIQESAVIDAGQDKDNHGQRDKEDMSRGKDSNDGTVVSILAIPSYMTPADLIGFVGHSEEISHIRMVRTGVPNRYMVLMKFRDPIMAKKFQQEYNGKLFNSMDPETCQVVFVSEIQFRSQAQQSDDIPYLLQDPFTAEELEDDGNDEDNNNNNNNNNRHISGAANSPVLARPPAPPLPPLRELPTCPVCLERMDASVTGLLTIVCQHTFHCSCLSKWGDGSCPVCRYSQPTGSKHPGTSKCNVCGSETNLWVCLICGHIGCGRYDQAHAYDHYIATSHCFTMDIDSQRVWDYASDGYVHRLLQNQTDGKLVEFPGTSAGGSGSGSIVTGQTTNNELIDKKVKVEEDLSLQYSYLMSSQLESQREYYEDILNSAADRTSEALEKADKAETLIEKLQAEIDQLNDTGGQRARLLEKELAKTASKSEKFQQLAREFERKYKEESTITKGMISSLENWKVEKKAHDNQIDSLKNQIQDLQEQVRDLMFFLDAKEKLQDEGSDVRQGTVSVGTTPSRSSRRRK